MIPYRKHLSRQAYPRLRFSSIPTAACSLTGDEAPAPTPPGRPATTPGQHSDFSPIPVAPYEPITTLRAGMTRRDFCNPPHVRTSVQSCVDIGWDGRPHSIYTEMRIASYDSCAHRCALVEAVALPSHLRPWTARRPTVRDNDSYRTYQSRELAARTAISLEPCIASHAGHGTQDRRQLRHTPDFPAGLSPCIRGSDDTRIVRLGDDTAVEAFHPAGFPGRPRGLPAWQTAGQDPCGVGFEEPHGALHYTPRAESGW